ncbi:MAG TPA: hypothetical protein VF997_22550 [Polyangia bacterium]
MARETRDDKARRDKLGIEPTIPATDVKSLTDFASERQPFQSGAGGPKIWIIVLLVAGVGAAFWWFSGDGAHKAAPTAAAPATAAAPKPAAAPTAAPPATATKPAAAATKPAATPAPAAAPAADAPSPAAAGAPAASPAHKRAVKRHTKKKPASKHKDVKLPRLPSPPPAD